MANLPDDPLALSASDIDTTAQEIILASARHDAEELQSLLRNTPSTGAEAANVKDSETGYTPLHAAIASMSEENVKGRHDAADGTDQTNGDGSSRHGVRGSTEAGTGNANQENGEDDEMDRAIKTVQLLFQNGAIWNELDVDGETPGCVAWRLGLKQLYQLVVDAGVRAELLFQRLDGYEPLDGEDDDDENEDDEDEDEEKGDQEQGQGDEIDAAVNGDANGTHREVPTLVVEAANGDETSVEASIEEIGITDGDTALSNPGFLSSRLTFTKDRLLDDQGNAVMMEWEGEIMQKTVAAIVPPIENDSGKEDFTVLNIGHGMGVIDTVIQEQDTPRRRIFHYIIEAHPAVCERMRGPGGFLDFDKDKDGAPNITLHQGRWQDILPTLAERGITFDAIFFDTFAEEYGAFRTFFEEWVITLLKENGRWSFFHGLGADRRVCYDVYTSVVEMDLFEAGFDVAWQKVSVPDLVQRGEWRGVKRQYWALDEYRLPVCIFTGR